jgi:hypothetical protein
VALLNALTTPDVVLVFASRKLTVRTSFSPLSKNVSEHVWLSKSVIVPLESFANEKALTSLTGLAGTLESPAEAESHKECATKVSCLMANPCEIKLAVLGATEQSILTR